MESIFNRAYEQISTYKTDKEKGIMNAIPVPFSRLSRRFPGFERGRYTILTANSGVGKTKVAKYILVTNIMKFALDNPDLDVHLRWYALEEGEIDFANSFISTAMFVLHGIKISTAQLKSLGDYTVSDDVLKKIDNCRSFLNDFMKNVHVIDDILNPYGIWKDVREFAAERGEFYYHNKAKGTITKAEPGTGFNVYKPKNPKEFVFIVGDHVSLLHREKSHKSDYEAIGKFSKDYCLNNMVKKLNYAVINIQQQVSDQEKMQYTYKGSAIESKVEPSLDGLANNKETQRDADLVLGIFAPTRYDITSYHGYKINPNQGGLGDNYRCIKFLKDRHYGMANSRIHLYFNGAINYMEELPKAEEMDDKKYKEYRQKY